MCKDIKNIVMRIFIALLVTCTFVVADQEKPCEETCEKEQSVVVTGIIPGSYAEDVGIREGDVIVTYNGVPVHCTNKLNALKESLETDSVEIVVKRDDRVISFVIPKGFIGVYIKEVVPDIDYDEDAVVIEGIGRLAWEAGESNSFMGALSRIVEYLKIKKDYTFLMGTSGAAFRILFHENWCPSSPDATVGFDCGTVALMSVGLQGEYLFYNKEAKNKQTMQKKILESIDKRMPVIAIDLITVAEWGLVVGYQKNGEELLVRTYFDKRKGYDIAEKFPWVVMTISQREGTIDDGENFKKSLRIAQELYETEKYEAYYSGIAALKYWINRLGEEDFGSLNDERYNDVMLANAWIYERLGHDRKIGAAYLKSFVTEFPQIEDDINALASIYEAEQRLIAEAGMIAPYPEQVQEGSDWTAEMRNKQIEILTQVLEQENEVYSIIKKINKKIEDSMP
ncbi:MAG: PDZ domain-containing protein [candidate division WOR-3 bacterium]|nr:MAG: PDZ domain-containing protein [candidate division WOR-3 bacterium]